MITDWHPTSLKPVNKCCGGEFYEVMLRTNEIECHKWAGFWPIPENWIKSWRGQVR